MNQWIAGEDVVRTVQTLIANNENLAPLALIEDQILVVFKEKASKSGDQVIAGKTGKAGPLLSVVSEKEYRFVITIAQDAWNELSDKDREALLFHHLCACGATENPKDGSLKTFVKAPDVSFYREEVERYGFWRTSGQVPEPETVNDLFGDPDPNSDPTTP